MAFDRPASSPAYGKPCTFGSQVGSIFGWLHEAQTPRRDLAVVICGPVGHEWLWSYRAHVKLAEHLASAGFTVLRFDYHGSGDSAGDDRDPQRFEAWLESARAAARELRARSGAARLGFLGVRVGALVAAQVASELADVEALALFSPCTTGRSFVRELRAFRLLQTDPRHADDAPQQLPGEPYQEVAGFAFTESTLARLNEASLLALPDRPAAHTLIIPREGTPADGKLVARLEQHGSQVTVREVPGYEAMMRESHLSEPPVEVYRALADWFTERSNQVASDPATPAWQPGTHPETVGGAKERAVVFGSAKHLFGMLATPERESDARRRPAILMLNVGTNHRVGPNRMYVRMARHWAGLGFASLRFDLAGMGDSQSVDDSAQSRLYSKGAIEDVVAAMDFLQGELGVERFILIGLCSGAYVAFQTALVEPRVAEIVLVNARRFYWQATDTLDNQFNTSSYRSMHAYRQLLFQPRTWRRLLSGDIDVKGISNRVRVVATARLKAAVSRLIPAGAEDERSIVPAFQSICDRGTRVNFIFSEGDDGLDYLQIHLGSRASLVKRPQQVSFELISGSDHTFSAAWTQQLLTEMLDKHFLSSHPAD